MSVLQGTCSIDNLSAAAKCFDCLSAKEKLALKVWFLAQGLKAAGGTDYTNVNTLLSAAACFKCEPNFRLDSFETVIFQTSASNSGASVDQSIATLRDNIKCLACADPAALKSALVLLECAYFGKGAIVL